MISYDPLFETMQQKSVTEYNLIYKQGISANTIYRIHHGMAITTKTLDTLCFILGCNVGDIIAYREDERTRD